MEYFDENIVLRKYCLLFIKNTGKNEGLLHLCVINLKESKIFKKSHEILDLLDLSQVMLSSVFRFKS